MSGVCNDLESLKMFCRSGIVKKKHFIDRNAVFLSFFDIMSQHESTSPNSKRDNDGEYLLER